MNEETYNRPDRLQLFDPSTCPGCLRAIRITLRGVIARHGWQEKGRRVGEVGRGVQSGRCEGAGCSPLEVSDGAARRIVNARRQAALDSRLATGLFPSTLEGPAHLHPRLKHPDQIDDRTRYPSLHAARARGVTFRVEHGPYGYEVIAIVPFGDPGVYPTVPSYGELHEKRRRVLEEHAVFLETSAQQIEEAADRERAR